MQSDSVKNEFFKLIDGGLNATVAAMKMNIPSRTGRRWELNRKTEAAVLKSQGVTDIQQELIAEDAASPYTDVIALASKAGLSEFAARRIIIEELKRMEAAATGKKLPIMLPSDLPKIITTRAGAKHLVIPDVQVKPGQDFEFLRRVGKYIVEKRPDAIICIGDFADMPSLSSYDKGKKSFEGRRYRKDIAAVHEAMEIMLSELRAYQLTDEGKDYNPLMIMEYGNHEHRIVRACEDNPELDGHMSLADLRYEEFGWLCYRFLDVVTVDGVCYSHYFTSGVMGRPVASARTMVQKKHQSCVMGHVQSDQIHTEYRADGKKLTGLFVGCCLTPNHLILKSDLQYVPLGSIVAGDKVVSFDENAVEGQRSRRYKEGTVLAVRRSVRETMKVTLQSGKVFTATPDHRWLVKTGSNYHWRTTESLRAGTRIPKVMDEWKTLDTREAGWLAGMYDGEGSLSARVTTAGASMQLSISQNAGPVLDGIIAGLKSLCGVVGVTCAPNGRTCQMVRPQGGVRKVASILGSIRPDRLLAKFKPEMLGRLNSVDEDMDTVLSVESVGENEIVEIDIDEKTMIIEGTPHHNCYEHDEDYLGPQGNNYWRGIWMLYEVNDGSFEHMQVSLDFLKKKYEKKQIADAMAASPAPKKARSKSL